MASIGGLIEAPKDRSWEAIIQFSANFRFGRISVIGCARTVIRTNPAWQQLAETYAKLKQESDELAKQLDEAKTSHAQAGHASERIGLWRVSDALLAAGECRLQARPALSTSIGAVSGER